MTIKKFRNFDIFILAIVVIIVDVVGVLFFKRAHITMYFAPSYAIVILAYVRWKGYGFYVHGAQIVTHIILYTLVTDDPLGVIGIHIFSLIGLSIYYMYIHHKKVKVWQLSQVWLMYLFAYIATFILEFSMMNLFGYQINLIDMVINHLFNFIFVGGILFLISKQKTLFIDMKHYFLNRAER